MYIPNIINKDKEILEQIRNDLFKGTLERDERKKIY